MAIPKGYNKELENVKHKIRVILKNRKLKPEEKNLKIYDVIRV